MITLAPSTLPTDGAVLPASSQQYVKVFETSLDTAQVGYIQRRSFLRLVAIVKQTATASHSSITYSWTRLNICEESLQAILDEHDVSSDFIDIVSCFHEKSGRQEEISNAPAFVRQDGRVLEYAYITKYCEYAKVRQEGSWRVRQSALYQRYDFVNDQLICILLSPHRESYGEQALERLVAGVKTIDELRRSYFNLDKQLLDAYLPHWRAYCRKLEQDIETLSNSIMGAQRELNVSSSYVKDLYVLKGQLIRLPTIFEHVQASLLALDDIAMVAEDEQIHGATVRDHTRYLTRTRTRVANWHATSRYLVQKHDNLSSFLDNTIIVQQNTRIGDLSRTTAEDSGDVRVITAIALLFLPLTTVATVLAMPLFKTDEASGDFVASPYIWVYFAAALPLTLVTVAYWRFENWRLQRRRLEYLGDGVSKV
ncbi:hypothetical protein AMS68_006065 [Peltaster fructicola]|uniref:Uncharacterized protein n=1 Tax=Peltaster fructicola TaxID=286661 RepID=A0A6H0Y128_9PEZI|nr:hypothetical protein AMS68_006065 [Peltaster fructicola]